MWFKNQQPKTFDRTKILFGVGDGDLRVFETLESAQSYIEPPDVGEWKVYTIEGKVVDVLLDDPPTSFWTFGRGTVRLVVTEKLARDEFRDAMLDNLVSSGMTVDSGAELESVVEIFLDWNKDVL